MYFFTTLGLQIFCEALPLTKKYVFRKEHFFDVILPFGLGQIMLKPSSSNATHCEIIGSYLCTPLSGIHLPSPLGNFSPLGLSVLGLLIPTEEIMPRIEDAKQRYNISLP